MRIAPPLSASTIDIVEDETPAVTRRGFLAAAGGLALGVLSGFARVDPAEAAGYYLLSTFDLKVGGTGKKSKLHHMGLYKIKGTDKFAIAVRPNGWVNSARTYYGSVVRAYPNGSVSNTIDSDRGYGMEGTRLIKFTMHTDGQHFKLYGSTKKTKKSKKTEYKRWITVWRGDSGGVHWAG